MVLVAAMDLKKAWTSLKDTHLKDLMIFFLESLTVFIHGWFHSVQFPKENEVMPFEFYSLIKIV